MSDNSKSSPDKILNVKNLLCPLPIYRTDAAMLDLEKGQTIEIQATDPAFVNDLPAYCGINGHKLLDIQHKGRVIIGLVEKGE
ncbi:MAG: sulfurtransferase TusA family protein [Magnetococcales bacterium]|nr:sulfurtransferase TusA family protein [Magnetococcales bacterium]